MKLTLSKILILLGITIFLNSCSTSNSYSTKLVNESLFADTTHHYFQYYSNYSLDFEIDEYVDFTYLFNFKNKTKYKKGKRLKVIRLNDPFNKEDYIADTLIKSLMIKHNVSIEKVNSKHDSFQFDFTKYINLESITLDLSQNENIKDATKKIIISEPLHHLSIRKKVNGILFIPMHWDFDVENLSIMSNTVQFDSTIVLPPSLNSLEFYVKELLSELKFNKPLRLLHLHFEMPSSEFENAVKNRKIQFENLVADSLYLPFEINEIPNLVNTSYKTIRTYYINSKILDLDKLPEDIETFHSFYINWIVGNTFRLSKLKNLSLAFEGEICQEKIKALNELPLESLGIFTNNYNKSLDEFLKKSTIQNIEIYGLLEDVEKRDTLYSRNGIKYHYQYPLTVFD